MTAAEERHDPDRPVHEHAWEDALEPRHLINRCDVILRVGAAMLASGTGARRVVETMRRVGRALDLDQIQTRVSLTEIVLTRPPAGHHADADGGDSQSGVNADQIAALRDFARRLPACHRRRRQRRPRRDPPPAQAVAGLENPIGAGAAWGLRLPLNHVGPVQIGAVFSRHWSDSCSRAPPPPLQSARDGLPRRGARRDRLPPG